MAFPSGDTVEMTVRVPVEAGKALLAVSDLAAVAAAKVTGLPLVTGQPDLAGLDPDVAVVVLRRRL